jgi:hypothetical protein
MNVLDKHSTLIFFAAKKYMQHGEYGSLMVEKDATQVQYSIVILSIFSVSTASSIFFQSVAYLLYFNLLTRAGL